MQHFYRIAIEVLLRRTMSTIATAECMEMT
jgi:hypothetical protein